MQGTQNGGIDGAPITASLPGGGWELLAENVLAALLDLECASGNDTRTSSSEIRVGAKIMPYLMAGTDLICSGFGAVEAYDNSFGASLFNAAETADFLALQREYLVEGGLRTSGEDEVMSSRERAVAALAAVLAELGLAAVTEAQCRSVVDASGSRETTTLHAGEITALSDEIRARGITLVDVIAALGRRGFETEADNLLGILKLRTTGAHLQTAAILKGDHVVSAVTQPNDYQGPGTGYRISTARRAEIAAVRHVLTKDSVLRDADRSDSRHFPRFQLRPVGPAELGQDPLEVVIGVSPAFALRIHGTTAGHPLAEVLRAITAGVSAGGAHWRVVRMRHTADTSFIGHAAARLAGSGIGIGLQAKGTAVIHQRGRLPHMNLELFPMAPIVTLAHYRHMGQNAARFARGDQPEPISLNYGGEAIHAMHHVKTALLHAIEMGLIAPVDPEQVEVVLP